MKKFILLLLVLFLQVFPQTGSLNSSATLLVKVPLSITAINANLDFGEIILAGNSLTPSVPPSQGARFIIQGTPASNISITFNSITLDNNQWVNTYGGTAGSLIFIPEVHDGFDNQIISGRSYLLSSGTGTGELNFNIGGSLTIPANQPPGDYTGQFFFTVSY